MLHLIEASGRCAMIVRGRQKSLSRGWWIETVVILATMFLLGSVFLRLFAQPFSSGS